LGTTMIKAGATQQKVRRKIARIWTHQVRIWAQPSKNLGTTK